MLTIIALSMSTLVFGAHAKAPATQPFGWQSTYSHQVGPVRRVAHRQHFHHRALPKQISDGPTVAQLRADVAALKREIASIRQEVGRPAIEPSPLLGMIKLPFRLASLPEEVESFPDLRLPTQPPALPIAPSLPSLDGLAKDAVDRVKEARLFLIRTATPGYTMVRLTPEVSIGRLHPAFAVKLAEAIKKARESGLDHAGIFSAYRPPIFGIGGFSDKFNSLHSYGMAVDVTGIGGPGSSAARLWERIVKTVGLFLPYGSSNPAEFNHTQFLSNKVAALRLRKTITASGPKDLREMWLASGVNTYVPTKEPEQQSVAKVPENVWP